MIGNGLPGHARTAARIAAYLLVTTATTIGIQLLVIPVAGLPVQVTGWLYLAVAGPVVVALTWWFRVRCERAPWRDIGLTGAGARRAVVHVLTGTGAGTFTVGLALAAHVWAGYVVVTGTHVVNPRPLTVTDGWPVVTGGPVWLLPILAVGALGLALATGVVEEVQYRGYVLAAAGARLPLWAAAAISGLLFTLPHLMINPLAAVQRWLIVPLLLGVAFVALRVASGALWLPIGFHAGFNWAHWQLFPGGPFPGWLGSEPGPERLSAGSDPVLVGVLAGLLGLVLFTTRRRIRWRDPQPF
ncbi:CPBP family intramembrane glutamic endopeptidase [Pseudonocardia kunmingensis]|uniref:CAAX prenyl protease-like protein n=1 Tax=Pseudonocardia kunmingensis TaxID=630975 RepID=A0A543DQ40_9PSEU|nr:CPBP family intramembrane glutamic endopeptidase [Pseudonocardia kunmingensis]TQM11450.1 CAAX prenyl protease-like protein [Pseudonocardia kunmingensis]